MNRLVALFVWLFCALPAQALTFSIEVSDLRPVGGVTHFIYASGPIAEGDTQRLIETLKSKNRQSNERVYVTLDSQGGSLAEGIKLGRTISEIGADTDVGRKTAKPLTSIAGECLSACVLAYLGGNYRYLKKDSKLGVHRFAFPRDKQIEPGTAVAAAQMAAAEIVKFIKASRADIDFFSVMTQAPTEEIYFVPASRLRELKVVTDNIWDEEWSFELVDGVAYLKIWQQSHHGENKLIFYCDSRKLVGMAFVEPPANHSIGVLRHTIGIFIDGSLETIPDNLILRQPRIEQKFANAAFVVTSDLGRRMLAARSIGAAMQPPNKTIYIGFKTDRQKDRDKLSKMIAGCR